MTNLRYVVLIILLSLGINSGAVAYDHSGYDDKSYFASKYHYKHAHHWPRKKNVTHNTRIHWGRHYHHGIHLDGHDGRP